MFARFLAAAALVAQLSGVAGLATPPTYVRCGTEEPPAALLEEAGHMKSKANFIHMDIASAPVIQVQTHFHVVSSAAHNKTIPVSMIDAQLSAMNTGYAPQGVQFTLIDTDFTVNDDWAAGNSQTEMKTKLRQGSYQELNVYFLSDLGGGLLGQCTFPTQASPGDSAFIDDGCIVLLGSMPGGGVQNYDLGYTATHEVGHWLGLFHPFQGSTCDSDGDMVADTPYQSTPTSGCPASKDSCPDAPGLDSIHNFMDYSYDSCMNQFTPDQGTRIHMVWDQYRK